jgi:glycerol-3-phosphate dehydrogenase subunit B
LSGRERAIHDLQEQLEMPVFEIPTLPPSIPGLRLQKILEAAIEKHGGVVLNGLQVVNSSFTPAQDSSQQKKALVSMETKAAWRRIAHPARYFILATGGILGGGLLASMTGELTEPITGAPVSAPAHRQDWFMQIQPDCHFLSPVEHPIFQAGIPVNGSFQPATPEGNPLIENLYAIGSLLAGADAIHERSREGIALVSGYVAGRGLF